MSQDAEDGPQLFFEGPGKTRPAMNQEEFDALFTYSPPKHKHSEFVRRTTKFLKRYVEPCTNPKAFMHTLVGFMPILDWLPHYDWRRNWLGDAAGGCTLAIIHIPQGIAYSLLAGVPPIVGLYISFFPPLFYMLFGTARHNSIGSFAVVALMARVAVDEFSNKQLRNETLVDGGRVLEELPDGQGYDPTVVASTLAFTIGLIHLVMGILRLEIITTYFSDAVVGGFSTGAAVHVFVSQIKDFFGIMHLPNRFGPGYLFYKVYDLAIAIPSQTNLVTLSMSICALIFLVAGKYVIDPKLKKRFGWNIPMPYELILMIIATGLALFFHVHSNYKVVIVGRLPAGMPSPRLPAFSLIIDLLPTAFSISVVVAAIHISLAKIFGKRLQYQTDSGQELYALGLTSVLAAFFPIYPVATSLSRTVVNIDAGSKTLLSTVTSSIIIAAVILWFGQLLRTLPLCILSTVIMVALTGMLKKVRELQKLWPLSKVDFLVWLLSFAATVGYDVTEGLVASIVFALFTTVFRTQFPRWHYLANLKGTNDFRDAERYDRVIELNGIFVFRFDAPLLFTNVERFKANIHKAALQWKENHPQVLGSQDLHEVDPSEMEKTVKQLNEIISVEPRIMPVPLSKTTSGLMYRHFIIDCSGFTFVDTMGVNALKEIFNELRSCMILVYFAAAKAPVRDLFAKCGFYQYVPKSNFYPTIRDAVSIARKRRNASTLHLLEEMSLPYDPLDEAINLHAVA